MTVECPQGLDLAHNFFPRLDARLLAKLPALRRLDVSANAITDVDPACFLDTPLIEHVNLSSNAIVALHPVTFRNLDSLFEVTLSLTSRGCSSLSYLRDSITFLYAFLSLNFSCFQQSFNVISGFCVQKTVEHFLLFTFQRPCKTVVEVGSG